MGDKRKKGTGGESAQPTRHRSGKAPGKKTLVDKHYGPLRRRKPAEAENAHMSVKASESPEAGAPLASWEGKTFFHVGEGEEPLPPDRGGRRRENRSYRHNSIAPVWAHSAQPWGDVASGTARAQAQAECQ